MKFKLTVDHNKQWFISAWVHELSKLPEIYGALASGETDIFRKLGFAALFYDNKQTVQIGKIPALCQAARQTHDLLGTEVLGMFDGIMFNMKGEKYMELIK